jgi:hypothetical protein
MMETGRLYALPSGASFKVIENPHENGGERVVFERVMSPRKGPAFITAYGDALAERFATGRLNRQEELPLLEILAITQATGGQSYRAGIPRGLQRAMLPAAAALARLRD